MVNGGNSLLLASFLTLCTDLLKGLSLAYNKIHHHGDDLAETQNPAAVSYHMWLDYVRLLKANSLKYTCN